MPDITFNIFDREYKKRRPQLDLLNAILNEQGFSDQAPISKGDPASQLLELFASESFDYLPVLSLAGMNWKKPFPDGRDFVLYFVGIGAPDPVSGAAGELAEYKNTYMSLPTPPKTEFLIIIMPDDTAEIQENLFPEAPAVTGYGFDYFMHAIAGQSSDPKKAKDVVKFIGSEPLQLEAIEIVHEALQRGDTKTANEFVELIGGGEGLKSTFRTQIKLHKNFRLYDWFFSVFFSGFFIKHAMSAVTQFQKRHYVAGTGDAVVSGFELGIATFLALSIAKPEITGRAGNKLMEKSKALFRRGPKPPEAKL